MDFPVGSMGKSLGVHESNVGFGDRTLGSLTSEMTENRARMLAQGGAEILLPGRGMLKRSQSGSELEIEMNSRDESIEQLKQARICSHGGSGLLIRRDPGRLSCAPSTSDDALLADHSPPFTGQTRMLSGPSYLSGPTGRHLPYQQQDPYLNKSSDMLTAGMQMATAREGASNLYDASIERRYTFTPSQWAELQHQALIYKYIIHGYPVPNDLVLPIRKSVAALSGSPYGISGVGWGSSSNMDAEPGRCRRTDGKKWRCSRPVVQEQKYCERHMHRGRHRSRKAAEAQTNSLSQPSPMSTSSNMPTPSVALPRTAPHSIDPRPPVIVNSSQQQQQVSAHVTKSFINGSATEMSVNPSCISARLPSSQFQLPPHSPASSMSTSKDPRLLYELRSQSADLQPDHPWPTQLSKMPSLIQQKQSCNSFYLYDSPLRSLQAQEMTALMEISPLSAFMDQRQQQQSGYFSSRNSSIDTAVEVKSEDQPLRHFFDDWPRSRAADSSTLSWSDADEEKPTCNASSTQLSIAILPTVSDLASANASPVRSKNAFSPLRLSMSKDGEAGLESMHVGLGMTLGSNANPSQQSLWFPMSMENSMGGPLAEALQSSSRLGLRKTGGRGLSLLSDGGRPDSSSPQESCRLPSPTGVLQKAFGSCFSDSSSRASSPASGKREAVICDQNLKSHATHGSPHVAT
ncbi:hypothetical protein O6H91_01G046900 [Diphasiastrum complanatum]|uniref:Uncharacterized protein n=1 Tax=Diphasiastrum complanatum TaxID=34168 RepID=A0ACC2EQL0_DIPCM|nr:hypothetical protein O6H91_01G046900 [Diphasiastrum complanatum]